MIDLIAWLLEPRWKENWRFSSLDNVMLAMEVAGYSQSKGPSRNLETKWTLFGTPITYTQISRTVIDTIYWDGKGHKEKTKNVDPSVVAHFIKQNFSPACLVVEKPEGRDIWHYDIQERVPTTEVCGGSLIYRNTNKKMRITKIREHEYY